MSGKLESLSFLVEKELSDVYKTQRHKDLTYIFQSKIKAMVHKDFISNKQDNLALYYNHFFHWRCYWKCVPCTGTLTTEKQWLEGYGQTDQCFEKLLLLLYSQHHLNRKAFNTSQLCFLAAQKRSFPCFDTPFMTLISPNFIIPCS